MIKINDYGEMQEIQTWIGAIDKEIIALISRRIRIVEQAMTNEEKYRYIAEQMLKERRLWAYRENLNADFIENIYKQLNTARKSNT